MPLVTCSEEVLVHLNHLGSLPDHTAVDHCLIVWLDLRGVVKNYDLSFEVVDTLGTGILVDQNHAFSERVLFQLLFLVQGLHSEADSLAGRCGLDKASFVVDGFHDHWLEAADLVRTKK